MKFCPCPTGNAKFPAFFAAIAALSLALAFIAEYGFDLKPCVLCLYQRIPFAIVIALGLAAHFAKNPSITCWSLKLITVTFAAGTALAAFHSGVEYGWWQGLATCGGDSSLAATIDMLRAKIMNATIIRCDTPAFVFLHLSMAGWNVLWSGLLTLASGHSAYHFWQSRNHA